jgi:hypothetical protein
MATAAAACVRVASPFTGAPIRPHFQLVAARRGPRRAGLAVSAAAAAGGGSPPTVLVTGAGGRTGRCSFDSPLIWRFSKVETLVIVQCK